MYGLVVSRTGIYPSVACYKQDIPENVSSIFTKVLNNKKTHLVKLLLSVYFAWITFCISHRRDLSWKLDRRQLAWQAAHRIRILSAPEKRSVVVNKNYVWNKKLWYTKPQTSHHIIYDLKNLNAAKQTKINNWRRCTSKSKHSNYLNLIFYLPPPYTTACGVIWLTI